MAVTFVDIGDHRMYLCSYNPESVLTMLYADYLAGRAAELLAGANRSEVHQWIRDHVPNAGPILDAVEAGHEIPRDVPMGHYPVTPGFAEYEAPVVAFLTERSGGGQ